MAGWRGRRQGLDGNRILDVSMLILVSSILGARLLWAASHPAAFRAPLGSWTEILVPRPSAGGWRIAGLSMMGGVVLATATALAYLRLRGLPVLRYADLLAPSVLLGAGITRLGCFLNGCCHGLPCAAPWAVRFPEGSPAARLFPATAVHPTQLYESALAFAGLALLLGLARRSPRPGTIFFVFLLVAGAGRAVLDPFRYYEESVVVAPVGEGVVNVSQVIALGLAGIGFVGLVLVMRGGKRPS